MGTLVVEGKTKLITKGDKPFTVNMIAKDFLTGGDAAKKEELTDIERENARKIAMQSDYGYLLNPDEIDHDTQLTVCKSRAKSGCDLLVLDL